MDGKQTEGAKQPSKRARAAKIVRITVRTLLIVLVGVMLVYNAYMLIARFAFGNEMPTVFGYAGATVQTGSMEPEIGKGDFVVMKRQERYEIGEVITYYSPQEDRYITHRIVGVSEAGYITRGDNNGGSDDPFPAAFDNVVGKVVNVLPNVGKFIQFMQSPAGLCCVAAGGIILWLVVDLLTGTFRNRKKEDKQEDEGKD